MDDPEDFPPPKPAKPSQTPSWVMLGFVLGALAVLALPRSEKKVEAPATVTLVSPQPEPPPAEKPTVEQAVFFEGVFAEHSQEARWQGNVTEVAFWNLSRRAFSDCFEVLRAGDKFYFRSIPHLTRPVLAKAVSTNSLLQFTLPVDESELQTTPTFDELNHGQFQKAITPARPEMPALPTAQPKIIKPVVDLPPPRGG